MGKSTGSLTIADIETFLRRLGDRYPHPTTLYLLGGSALCLLGSPRRTLDIDYFGSDRPDPEDVLAATIRSVATELHIEIEGVPLDQFIPLPQDSDSRHRFIGRFGNLIVYVFDPYSIAISKLDRGFETDPHELLQHLASLKHLLR